MATTLTDTLVYNAADKKRLARIVFSLILCSLVWSFCSHTQLHQLRRPVVTFPYVDPTYWLFNLLRIPAFVTGNPVVALVFDVLLMALCIGALVWPHQRLLAGLFVTLYFIYFITYNTYGTHHTNPKIGILLMAVPFIARSVTTFNFLWQGLRYFLLFAYSCAFLWKLLRFSWLDADMGLLIMQKNMAPYLYYHPDTVRAALIYWFLQHAGWTYILFLLGLVLEGMFLVGFFTKKYDKQLFVLSLLCPLGFWFMADAYFYELLIWSLTLYVPFYRYATPSRYATP
jgi:hypothetical protein